MALGTPGFQVAQRSIRNQCLLFHMELMVSLLQQPQEANTWSESTLKNITGPVLHSLKSSLLDVLLSVVYRLLKAYY